MHVHKLIFMTRTCRNYTQLHKYHASTWKLPRSLGSRNECVNGIIAVRMYSPRTETATVCDNETAVNETHHPRTRTVNIKVPNHLIQSKTSNNDANVADTKMGSAESGMSSQNGAQELTVFLKNYSMHVDVLKKTNNGPNVKELTINMPNTKDILNLNISYGDSFLLDSTNPSQNIESIGEVTWRDMKLNLHQLPQYYMKLSKIRLTGMVVITTMAGYAVAPDPFQFTTFWLCSLGTALTSCSANAINQYFEVPFDAQMNRTKNRVLVRGHLSPLHAVTFAIISGTLGVAILAVGVNPLTAALGAFNLGLYTFVYTPMKRVSILNTWVGSLVGAIPPMMGWTACTGMLEPGAILLGAILYAWQFPHFMSLSWNLRPDYSRAGYRMASVINPELCKLVALRYSVGMIAICGAAPLVDLTTWTFAANSLPLNIYLAYLAWNFYSKGDSNSSRKLFKFSLLHIPFLMMLLLISKKGHRGGDTDKTIAVTDDNHNFVM